MRNWIVIPALVAALLVALVSIDAYADETIDDLSFLLDDEEVSRFDLNESEISSRIHTLDAEVDDIARKADRDIERKFYSMAEQRYRRLADLLQDEIGLLEMLRYESKSVAIRAAASGRLDRANDRRDRVVNMVKLLAVR